ncbi:MAG: aryl-sulfate sulfotransferase [Crocinitomicaceae bacterium]
MKSFLLLLGFIPFLTSAQPDYTILTNNGAHTGNLFFQVGGPPSKPVNIVNSSGALIYSADFGSKGWAWKVNLNDKITYFDRQSKGWFVMDSLENVVDTVYCQNGYIADNHDFIALENGNYILFSYDQRDYATDTISPDGNPDETVIGLVIQELDSDHNVVFEWLSWNHFYMSDYSHINYGNSNIDFLHCNAIDLDEDGHFLISNRNISEITKIHRTTGEIIWRLGGQQSDFTFTNDYPFSNQHCIKSLGENRYLLYDNGNLSNEYTGGIKRSRGVEYELDLNNATATKTWSYVHPDSLFTPSIGSVQRLDNGNTLINFGNNQLVNRGSVITEVNANNEVVFEMEFDNGQNIYCANKSAWNFYNEPTVGLDLSKIPEPNENIQIFPNPSNTYFFMESKLTSENISRIEIFNLNGQMVFEQNNLGGGNKKITHGLNTGSYLTRITSNKGSYIEKLQVIK